MVTLESKLKQLTPARRKKILDRVAELIAEQKSDKTVCKSKNPDVMCSDCDCWKQTRSMCS